MREKAKFIVPVMCSMLMLILMCSDVQAITESEITKDTSRTTLNKYVITENTPKRIIDLIAEKEIGIPRVPSWDVDEPGRASNNPENTEIHMNWISGYDSYLSRMIDYYGGGNVDVAKACLDMYTSRRLKNIQTFSRPEASSGLADYRWLRDHGIIMNEKSSFAWGIKMNDNMIVRVGHNKVLKPQNAPSRLGVTINTAISSGTDDRSVRFEKPIWTSSNDRVAKVDNNGKVTGIKKGKATIQVKYDIWVLDLPADHYKFKNGNIMKVRSMIGGWWDPRKNDYWVDGYYCSAEWKYPVIRKCKVTVK